MTFVETIVARSSLIARNIARCGIADGYVIIGSTVLQAIETLRGEPSFDVVLLDPPYTGVRAPRQVQQISGDTHDVLQSVGAIVTADGIVVFEHAKNGPTPASAGPCSARASSSPATAR